MPFRVGHRVAAAQALGAFGDIRRGTPGTVLGVSYLGAYDVKFVGGRLVRGLRRDQLTARRPAFGLIESERTPAFGLIGSGCCSGWRRRRCSRRSCPPWSAGFAVTGP